MPPVLVSVALSSCAEPTVTFPKDRLAGLATNDPGATALPVKGKVSMASVALLAMLRLPFASPEAWGVKVKVTVVL